MRKMGCAILAGTLCLLLWGCGAASEETGEPTTIQQAQFVEAATAPAADPQLPERLTETWSSRDGSLTVSADAAVTAEQGTALPAALVERRRFTQEDLDHLLAAFAKGNPCRGSRVETKQDLQKMMDILHKNYDGKAWPEDALAILEDCQKKMKTAPDEADIPPVTTFWIDVGFDCPVFYADTTVDGRDWRFEIVDNGTTMCQAIIYRKDYGPIGSSRLQLERGENFGYEKPEQSISSEQAQNIGDGLMEQLGLSYMVCDDIRTGLNGAQLLYYVPMVEGIRLSCVPEEIQTPEGNISPYVTYRNVTYQNGADSQDLYWSNEAVWLEVGTEGILSFKWEMPCTVTELVTDHAALMSFEEIKGIAGMMLPRLAEETAGTGGKDAYGKAYSAEIHRVNLTLMRIRDKYSNLGRVVPVWDFWGTVSEASPDSLGEAGKPDRVLLTLNAVDGSVIQRSLGY